MQISKYNASGNDFIIFQAIDNAKFYSINRSDLAVRLCDRFNGVGADGLIIIKRSKGDSDFAWEFYNSDGSEAAMCGNGSRAAALYAYKNQICDNSCSFETGAGIIRATTNENSVEVALSQPKRLSEPFYEMGLEWSFYDTGVPHLVSFVDDLAKFDLEICKAMRKKYNANVNYAKFDGKMLLVRTFERGVENETNACGTGMAAAFFTGFERFGLDKKASVMPKSKEILSLRFDGQTIHFGGKVSHIFDTAIY
ncbi:MULTISPECIES: diaminopimelate epimerase [Campylobacter]|uniref:diaminopimelate epimerase n=1 Tax=Campylobacter TaxID=194 RepID=UPI000A3421DC|nr:diaminopimelate epimerase [Campylobacter sp. P0024]MCR8679800.1 diaminopimelate epimerase [Campylobacter sp. RM19072]